MAIRLVTPGSLASYVHLVAYSWSTDGSEETDDFRLYVLFRIQRVVESFQLRVPPENVADELLRDWRKSLEHELGGCWSRVHSEGLSTHNEHDTD